MKVDDRSRSLSIVFKFFRHVEFKIESNRSSHAFIMTCGSNSVDSPPTFDAELKGCKNLVCSLLKKNHVLNMVPKTVLVSSEMNQVFTMVPTKFSIAKKTESKLGLQLGFFGPCSQMQEAHKENVHMCVWVHVCVKESFKQMIFCW